MNFYIGQPVRIVRCRRCPELEGTEAAIASELIRFFDFYTGEDTEGYEVLVNGAVLCNAWGGRVMPTPDQLEPRSPDGMESPEEIEELFEPECELVIVR